MNLPNSLQELTSSPLITLALLLTVVAVLLLVIYLIFFFIPKKIPEGLKFIKKHPLRSFIFFGLFLVAASIFYAFYYFGQPVKIISAAQFKSERAESISQLQQGGFNAWPQAKLYLIDIRSRDEYAVEHLIGSANQPVVKAKKEYPIEGVDIAVIGTSSRFEEARQVAETIKKNGVSVKYANKSKVGKIYVIRDGFEGLKKAGLATEAGIWD